MLPGAMLTIQRNEFIETDFAATETAFRKFTTAHRRGWWRRFRARLFRQSARLRSLQDLESTQVLVESRYRGIAAIPLAQIQGSENRSHDFDDQFHPLHQYTEERWLNIARAMLQDQPLPPVELIQVGEAYYVRDGHHRVSVARALGQQAIDAIVTERVMQNKQTKVQRLTKNLLDENSCIPVCYKQLPLQECCCS